MKSFKLLSLIFAIFLVAQISVFPQTKSAAETYKFAVSKEDDAFLEDLSKRSFMYLWEQSDEKTGLTLDRARTTGEAHPATHPSHNIASSAATGFALTGLCIASERGWVSPDQARTRARVTLDFYANRAFHKNGWFYHWLDKLTGERRWDSEISSIDTALLLGGILSVRQCFADDREIVKLATQIYVRVDFKWMLDGDKYLFSHGWKPETGFLKNRWHDYSENASLYLLGIGSPTHPISWQSWYAFKRDQRTYKNFKYIAAISSLFIHQYSQAWFDFRGKREHYKNFKVNYQVNSEIASRAQRQFCRDLSQEFAGYAGNLWGISASDSAKGYIAWGGPPREPALDGTVVPYAPAASLMFAPDISLPALKEMKEKYGEKIYGRYGFTDAFNPNTGWVGSDDIGIDVGITLLGIENFRTGNVWKWFMKNTEMKNALTKAKIY